MFRSRSTRLVALAAGLAVALPAGAAQAGGDAPPTDPPIVGVPIARTQAALSNAADAIDSGKGADAVGPMRAIRRGLIRSYRGAKFLIASAPPAPPEEARVSSRKFIRLAKRAVRASRRGASSGWIRAQASGDAAGPVFADTPTAVFDVFNSQFNAATSSAGMVADVKGKLLDRTQTALNTAVVLRNRLVKIVHAAAPPAPPEEAKAHASQEADDVATFDTVMPGVAVLIGAELQQLQALSQDTSVPAASQQALSKAIAADTQIQNLVNTWWPPVVDD